MALISVAWGLTTGLLPGTDTVTPRLCRSVSPQRPVCHCEEVPREKHGAGVRGQIHQKAAEPGQPAGRVPGGDRARGEHPAAGAAPQRHHAARRLREPHRRGAHP